MVRRSRTCGVTSSRYFFPFPCISIFWSSSVVCSQDAVPVWTILLPILSSKILIGPFPDPSHRGAENSTVLSFSRAVRPKFQQIVTGVTTSTVVSSDSSAGLFAANESLTVSSNCWGPYSIFGRDRLSFWCRDSLPASGWKALYVNSRLPFAVVRCHLERDRNPTIGGHRLAAPRHLHARARRCSSSRCARAGSFPRRSLLRPLGSRSCRPAIFSFRRNRAANRWWCCRP
jgi:hypothetical protein